MMLNNNIEITSSGNFVEIVNKKFRVKLEGSNKRNNINYNFYLTHKCNSFYVCYTDNDIRITLSSSGMLNLILEELLLNYPIWSYSITGHTMISNQYYGNITLKIYINLTKILSNKNIKSRGLIRFIDEKYIKTQINPYIKFKVNDNIKYLPQNKKQQPINGFNLNLFPYQYNTVMWMLDLEKNSNIKKIDYTLSLNINDTIIKWDCINNDIVDKSSNLKLITNGGILADEMGLGKTITAIALTTLNPLPNNQIKILKNNLIQTGATLIFVPSHLAKQWKDEIKKVLPFANVISILTKPQHQKINYNDILNADFVILSHQFLLNFKYYPRYQYRYCTPSSINNNDRFKKLRIKLENYQNFKFDDSGPILELFYWNRIMIDEGHEILGNILKNNAGGICDYLREWLNNMETNYRWFISGTPYINYNGFINLLKFLKVKITIPMRKIPNLTSKNNNKLIINYSYNEKSYNNDNFFKSEFIIDILKKHLMVRHKKEDISNQLIIPKFYEKIFTIELTQMERQLYNSNLSKSRDYLIQLCCHPLVALNNNSIAGIEIELASVQAKLISYHSDRITNYKTKIKNLDSNNQSYSMQLAKYNSILSSSTYLLNLLEKIDKKEKDKKEYKCAICLGIIDSISITECGHIFCRDCLLMAMNYKKQCPMCKHKITSNIYSIGNKIKENIKNPLCEKYGAKMGFLISLCRKLITNSKNRIIIFSQYDRMLQLIGKTLKTNGVSNSFVKGNVWQRNKAINSFKKGNNLQVIMLSLKSTASGTNLTEATHIIFTDVIDAEKEKVKTLENQAIARACRLGQKNQVGIFRLITKDTIEEKLWNKEIPESINLDSDIII